MRIQFNTGRSYTEVGQRVVAQTAKGYFGNCSGIRFHDIDRGCCGVPQPSVSSRFFAGDHRLPAMALAPATC